MSRQAGRVASARLFGEWRRRRLLRRHGFAPHPGTTADACVALAGFADAELAWRTARSQVTSGPDDHGLTASLATAESKVRTASAALLDGVVRSAARNGRVGTVHSFQGGERDMIFSLVAGQGMRDRSIRWVDRQLNMWNVAITRARSHLIVVGDSELWRGRGGVGAALWAAANTAGGNVVGKDGGEPRELVKRLYRSLSTGNPGGGVELGGTVNGHPTDALVRQDDGTTAVLLDPGPGEGTDEVRHLRLMLRRRELLDGRNAAVRIPAWRLYDGQGRCRVGEPAGRGQ